MDSVSTLAVSTVFEMHHLTGMGFPLTESLYAARAGDGDDLSAVAAIQFHAVYLVAPSHRERDLERGARRGARQITEMHLRKEMRQYATPEQWEETVSLGVNNGVVAAER
jgi:hypothetical protein